MSRNTIRAMKRVVAAGLSEDAAVDERQKAQESALALLDRSIGFGHRRLAVIRLATAVNAGAEPRPEHWSYCRDAAEQSRDAALLRLWLTVVAQAQQPRRAALAQTVH
jgi:hypothetical protein